MIHFPKLDVRGFESHLPLHVSNNLAHSTSSCFTPFTSKTRLARIRGSCGTLCRPVSQRPLKLCNRFSAAFQIALGVRVDGHADCMTSYDPRCGDELERHSLTV